MLFPRNLILGSITLFLLLSTTFASDSDEIEELLALDEQEQQNQEIGAGMMAKAQRIVLELDSENAKRIIDKNEYVLVLGIAPWCVRSAELMPQFAQAATLLKELGSSVLMAKLDGERYPKIASLLDIKGFPTMILFVNGTAHPYTGGFSAEEIVIWARKKTGVPVIRINTVSEAVEFLKKFHLFVIGLFEKFEGDDYEEFIKAALSDNEIQFVEVNNVEVAKVLFPDVKAKNFLGIVKSEPERYTEYDGKFEMGKIMQFLDYNKFPLVTKLTEMNSVRVYASPIKLQVVVFAKPDVFKNLLEPLQDVARKFKTKIMFIYIDITDENQAKPFLTMFGLEDSENTLVTAFDTRGNSKFLLEAEPTPSNIQEFCFGLFQSTLIPYYKSQPIPENKNESVMTVVGKTFDALVLNSPKNVLLEVHTPWCINCETTSKQIEKLAKHFKTLDNLLFTKIDASANEHPKLQVDDYPTLLFYKTGSKNNPIKISTKSSSKDLAGIINKHLKGKEQGSKDEL